MATQIEIANLALRRIGQKTRIVRLTDNSAASNAVADLWSVCRDAAQVAHPWFFNKRRATLVAPDELVDPARSGWAFVFTVPTDCLLPRFISPPGGGRQTQQLPDQRVPFELEQNAAGTGFVLLTDEESPELVYSVRVERTDLYPPHFVDVLGWQLASELIVPLTAEPKYGPIVAGGLARALAGARVTEKQSRQDDHPTSVASSGERARGARNGLVR